MIKQILLIAAGILSVALLFDFGPITEPNPRKQQPQASAPIQPFDLTAFASKQKSLISPDRQSYIFNLEKELDTANTSNKILIFNKLASFWKDTIPNPLLYAYHIGELTKLDNSEKNLNFAAQLFLEVLRSEDDEAKIDWLAKEAIQFFEKAIELQPQDDDLKIGLGSVYIFGKGRGGAPEETMKGIQEILAVVKKDSNNMKAQLMLGIGGIVSGQYDKALIRLQKVVNAEPDNVQAVAFLADTYAAQGNKAEAIKWYQVLKQLANDPHTSEEVDKRIKQLR